jgi:hypothetical protein
VAVAEEGTTFAQVAQVAPEAAVLARRVEQITPGQMVEMALQTLAVEAAEPADMERQETDQETVALGS